MKPMSLTKLADLLYSSAIVFASERIKKGNSLELPRFITVDMQIKSVLTIDNNGSVVEGDKVRGDLGSFLESYMDSSEDLEFVYYDEITQTVMLFTKQYLSALEEKRITLKDAVMRYYKLWYLKKCGSGGNHTITHNEHFKTFSKTEVEFLNRTLIPIITIPRSLTALHNAMEYAIQVSPLHPHVVKDTGFDIKGKRVENTITWWIHHPIAQIYLGKDRELDVFSEMIVDKLLEDAGFGESEALSEIKELDIDLSEMNLKSVEDILADKHGYGDDNKRQAEIQRVISTNALDSVPTQVGSEIEPAPVNKSMDLSEIDLEW